MNTNSINKNIKILCVGGKMRVEGNVLPAEYNGLQFLMRSNDEEAGQTPGVSENEIMESDALLLFLGGSGWDWLERLRLPPGIISRRPLVAIIEGYEEKFALGLLKLGIEEIVSSSEFTPARLRFSILSAITRFQRRHKLSSANSETSQSVYEQTALKALDTIPFGIMFTDKDSHVLFMNSAAKNTCTNGSGVYVSKDKRCCAVDPDENSTLHRLVSKLSHEAESGDEENHTLKITGKDGGVLTMLMVSVGKKSADHGVAIFLDSGNGFFNISEETLKSVYGLTQSEAELLLRMVHGETLAEVSEARGVTMHTVRAQLKSVFAKTDTNRQASLIKKVLTGPAVLMQR